MKTSQLFTTPSEIEKAVSDLRALQSTPGWQVVCMILDENIRVVTDQILNKTSEDTEEEMDRLRGNLKIMKDIRFTPEKMIKNFTDDSQIEVEQVDAENVYDSVPDPEEKKT